MRPFWERRSPHPENPIKAKPAFFIVASLKHLARHLSYSRQQSNFVDFHRILKPFNSKAVCQRLGKVFVLGILDFNAPRCP